MGPKRGDKFLYKRQKRKRQTERGEGDMKMEAEIGLWLLWTKEFLEPPEAGRGKDLPWIFQREPF